MNPLPHNYDFFTTLNERPFENIVRKGENAGNQHFLLFPQCFLPFLNQGIIFHSNAFNLEQSMILSFGKELKGEAFKNINANIGY